jgi:hypothetical protein
MTSEDVAKRILVITLGIAAVVVLSTFFVPNRDDLQAVTFVLITIWLVPFGYLIRLRKRAARKLPRNKEPNTREDE